MKIVERKVRYPKRKKLSKLNSNNEEIESYFVELEDAEGDVYEKGTPITKEMLDTLNWKDDSSISFVSLPYGQDYPIIDSEDRSNKIYMKNNGELWVIPCGEVEKRFKLEDSLKSEVSKDNTLHLKDIQSNLNGSMNYTNFVIPLLDLTNDVLSIDRYFFGKILLKRTNAVSGLQNCIEVSVSKLYDSSTPIYECRTNGNIAITPCTFNYNNRTWFGLNVLQTGANYQSLYAICHYNSIDDIKTINYYNNQTGTVINGEINYSLKLLNYKDDNSEQPSIFYQPVYSKEFIEDGKSLKDKYLSREEFYAQTLYSTQAASPVYNYMGTIDTADLTSTESMPAVSLFNENDSVSNLNQGTNEIPSMVDTENTWIDGRKIFKKIYTGHLAMTETTNIALDTPIETIISISGNVRDSSTGIVYSLNTCNPSNIKYSTSTLYDGETINLSVGTSLLGVNNTYILVLEYVK